MDGRKLIQDRPRNTKAGASRVAADPHGQKARIEPVPSCRVSRVFHSHKKGTSGTKNK